MTEQQEYEHRVAACLKACEGIPTDVLEAGYNGIGMSDFERELVAQRDVLLDAVVAIIATCDRYLGKNDPSPFTLALAFGTVARRADAAMAALKKGGV